MMIENRMIDDKITLLDLLAQAVAMGVRAGRGEINYTGAWPLAGDILNETDEVMRHRESLLAIRGVVHDMVSQFGKQMNPQPPAKGIMLQNDFGSSKSFKVECDCSSEDHAIYMWIELSETPDVPDIEVSFYVRTWTPLWKGWTERLKAVYEILFKGVHKQEHHMLLSEQAATNLAHAILDNVEKVKNERN